MNKNTIEKIVKELLDDDEFVYDCLEQIKKIMEDHEIDMDDIPDIISLVIITCKKYYLFTDISKQDIIEIFTIVILEIFNKYKILNNKNQIKVKHLVESCLKLFISKIEFEKTICFPFYYLKNKFCCLTNKNSR